MRFCFLFLAPLAAIGSSIEEWFSQEEMADLNELFRGDWPPVESFPEQDPVESSLKRKLGAFENFHDLSNQSIGKRVRSSTPFVWKYEARPILLRQLWANPNTPSVALLASVAHLGVTSTQVHNFRAKTKMRSRISLCVYRALVAGYAQKGDLFCVNKASLEQACNEKIRITDRDLELWIKIVVVPKSGPTISEDVVTMTTPQFQALLGALIAGGKVL